MSQNMQMTDQAELGFTLQDLEVQKIGLEGRIRKIEQDLHEPMSPDHNEQAVQTMQFIFMKRLLEVERSNLIKVNFEIEKKKQF